MLLPFGGTGELDRDRRASRVREEGVHSDERQGAVVLALFAELGLVLDSATLVAGFHGSQHAAAVGDALELSQHGFLDEVAELVDEEGPLGGFPYNETPHYWSMIIWIARARRIDSAVGVVTASS